MAKLINEQEIRVDLEATSNRTINSVFVQYSLYSRYSTNGYRQLIADRVEDFCGYMKGDNGNIALSHIFPDYVQFTNVNHTCPYVPGYYFFKISNFTMNDYSHIIFAPSGKYRLEISAHDGYKGPMYGKVHLYLSVSDQRVVNKS